MPPTGDAADRIVVPMSGGSSSTATLPTGEAELVDSEGRRWPRITKENAAEHKAPNLHDYDSTQRGPTSPPWCWYVQISGETTWDQSSKSYREQKNKWAGWAGGNERRAEQRRASAQQQAIDNEGKAKRTAAEAEQAAASRHALPPNLVQHAEFVEARAAAMAASLLGAIGEDGMVEFCSMELGLERRMHEQLKLNPFPPRVASDATRARDASLTAL